MFLCDVACQKLLKSANVSRSYSKNNTGTVFLRRGVYISKTVKTVRTVSSIVQCSFSILRSLFLLHEIANPSRSRTRSSATAEKQRVFLGWLTYRAIHGTPKLFRHYRHN